MHELYWSMVEGVKLTCLKSITSMYDKSPR